MRKALRFTFFAILLTAMQPPAMAEPVLSGLWDRSPHASHQACPEPQTFWQRVLGKPLPPKSIQSFRRTEGLPTGRTYYGGRYFGNFNNRFFGPQYGYF